MSTVDIASLFGVAGTGHVDDNSQQSLLSALGRSGRSG